MTDGQTVDRRVRRTQGMIIDAFLSLCQEKEFGDIIIKDITERANVNRSTFYAHYEDKEDLLNRITNEKLSALTRLSREQATPYEPGPDTLDPYYVALFEHLADNKLFYSVILGKMNNTLFADKMTAAIRESLHIRISSMNKEQKLLVSLDILLDYASFSIQGILTKWLAQQSIHSPRHMALQLTRLSLLGIYKATGITER
ncbi:TetR/AcrR family transcriptional regulator [Paenibacillus oenotherae]|uniref:TetR/AcrR family transcriptional regulator n=1 Tax=Paenibacillus oenotherae TaxID=1435645 RepID=A0ABS7DBJ6_9BACL|nr:TetR/AcrR family transcriptional regulator [Paenibacillus oenotherae]MBW7477225.1 TetR/AcrR family transcriptional regulator [Paenibacillus oenotherae]